MLRVRFVCLLLCFCCLCTLFGSALAAEVDCDATYCFTAGDFSPTEEPILGICITGLPDPRTGTVLLGTRMLRRGDILTAEQLSQMCFQPLRTQADLQAQVCYLPIYANRVEESATMTLQVRGKEDKPPVAEDSAFETYKNLSNSGRLAARDPEEQPLTYTLVRQPRRGVVELAQDGSFTYTPKKNKVGVDSFTYTATDPAGNVSREATVTVQVLKPTQLGQYSDTAGLDCRFEAEWLRNTGLFSGETVADQLCFRPALPVSKGQFLTMLVETLDLPVHASLEQGIPEDTPQWLRPYLSAAMRSGLLEGWTDPKAASFPAEMPITGAEAAVLLQNALDLTVTQQALETAAEPLSQEVPAWAASALTVLRENGLSLTPDQTLTRGDTAQLLYQVSLLAVDAPGMAVFRMQQ